MPVVPDHGLWPVEAAPRRVGSDPLTQAASILEAEVARTKARPLPGPIASYPAASNGAVGQEEISDRLTCPVTGARIPASPQAGADLQALAARVGGAIRELANRIYPVTGGAIPFARPQREALRRDAHELIEALLTTFSESTGEQGAAYDDRVPLLHGDAPAAAGSKVGASMRVANDEPDPAEVSLYCTNFVGDTGHEIPSLCVVTSPRQATIPGKADAAFAIEINVPRQTAPGVYTGLIQAMGCKYVKAVLSIEVL
jgi:hypothetical protein